MNPVEKNSTGFIFKRKVRIGKCVWPGTKVHLINGEGKLYSSRPLRDYKDGTKLKTLSIDFKTGKIVPSQSTVIKQKESKDFYKVKLKNGKEIICSLDHKLFVQRNKHVIELKLSEIKIGDKLCIKEK